MPLKLYKRGKVWHYRGTVAGRRLRGSTGSQSKEIAERVASNKEQLLWKGHLDGPSAILTFAQAAMLYRDADKSDRYLRPIEDYWKDTPVKQITAEAIRSSANALYPGTSGATRNRQVIVPTQAIINYAAKLGQCSHIRVERFKVIKKEKQPATWEWVQAFMRAATKPNLSALACLLYLTGSRISVALAIQWKEVNLARATIRIGSSKGGDERLVHMPPELVAAIANIPGERSGPLFGVTSPSNFRTQWAGAIRRAGIERLSYHRLRHGFATGLLDKGVNPITVAKRGGWKNARHVFETYGHDIAPADITNVLTGTNPTQQRKKSNVAS